MVIYKTTNLINGNFYIGKDKYNDPEYLGSGLLLNKAILKYGRENFKKEILEECTSYEQMNEREKFWISEFKCCEDSTCYNISTGGDGGDNITHNPNRDAFIAKQKLKTGELNSMFGKTHSVSAKLKMSHPGELNGMFGKNHREDAKQKQKEKAKGRYTLPWFIERYGEELGQQKYKERGEWRTRCMEANKNPSYKHIDKDEIVKFIQDNPDCKLIDLSEALDAGSTRLYQKFRMYFSAKNLKEVKKYLKDQEN